MTIFSSVAFSQQGSFQLNGEIKGIDTGSVKLVSLLNDSSWKKIMIGRVDQGKFVISEKIPHPVRVYLVLNGKQYSEDFFVVPGSQDIYFDATEPKKFSSSMKVTGSPVNDEFVNYQKWMQPFYDEYYDRMSVLDSLNKVYTKEKPAFAFGEAISKYNLSIKILDSAKQDFFLKHPTSYISLWVLYDNSWFLYNLELVTGSFPILSNDLQNSVAGKQLAKRIDAQKALLDGNVFPVMIMSDSAEKKMPFLRKVEAKYTLIDFWFSGCVPCIAEFPSIHNLYSKYRQRGFDVIGISIDMPTDKQKWLDVISKHKLNWKQYWDIEGKEAKRFYIDSYPTTFLLDKKGKIIKKNIPLEELAVLLEKELR